MEKTAHLLIDSKNQLGEGPLWHPDKKILYWVDITLGKLNCIDPLTNQIHQWQMDGMIGTVALSPTEDIIVALETGIYRFSTNVGLQKLAIFPEPKDYGNRFNDGKCDPSGRLWIGTMNKQVRPMAGTLYCFDGDKYIPKLPNVTIPNGMAWAINQRKFYFTDSFERTVKVYDFDNQTGCISSEKVIIEVPETMGVPDGMTIDSCGMLWIAHWGASCVARWNPENGELLEIIEVPAPNVSSCILGGNDLQTLFITTAREGLTEKQLLEYPLSGGVFFYKVKTAGINSFMFKT